MLMLNPYRLSRAMKEQQTYRALRIDQASIGTGIGTLSWNTMEKKPFGRSWS
jgi:hypothetical protein